jgi:hypothetical protein
MERPVRDRIAPLPSLKNRMPAVARFPAAQGFMYLAGVVDAAHGPFRDGINSRNSGDDPMIPPSGEDFRRD